MAIHRYKKLLEEMLKSGKRMFKKDRMARTTTFIAVVFVIATTALPIWRLLPLSGESPFIALHYNVYLGVDRFGPMYQIFFIPAMGLLFLLLNLVIQIRAYKHQKTLSLFFAASTPLLELILLVAMVLIVLINL